MRQGGTPGRPIVIRSADPSDPARLTRSRAAVNMLEIHASDLVIRGLAFGPTATDADGVRIITGSRITVEGCRFTQMGGIAVAANHSSLQELTVRDVQGRSVRVLSRSWQAAGSRQLAWDGTDDSGARVAPGVYLVTLRVGSHQTQSHVTLLQ